MKSAAALIPGTLLPTALCALLLAAAPAARPAGAQEPVLDESPAEEAPASTPGGQPQGLAQGSQPARGEDPARAFLDANSAYESGYYAKAVELYAGLVEAGIDTGHVHYNLANAYLRNGELGRSIASYRRAAARLPRDEDVRANLAFARKSTKDALAPPAPSPVLRTLLFWHHGLARSELALAFAALNVLFWGVVVLRLFHRASEVLRWLFMVLLILLLAIGGSLGARWAFPTRVAVVIPQEIEARSGTSIDAVVRFKLHAGTEVEVVEGRDSWLRITLPDGQQGWIDRAAAEVVEF